MASHPHKRSAQTRIALGAVVTAVMVALLLVYGDYRAYAASLAEAQYWKLWPLLLLAPMAQAMRAYRLSVLLGPSAAFDARLFHLASTHMLFSSVLPLRAGELALPVLLKVQRKVQFSTGVGYVLVLRMFDLLVLLMLCGLAATFVAAVEWKILFGSVSVASTLAALALPSIAVSIRSLAAPLAEETTKWRRIVDELAQGAADLRNPLRWLRMWLASIAVWMLMFSGFYISCTAVTSISPSVVVLAGGAASLAVAQPINGIAGLGVVQAAWAWAANQLGVEWTAAVASGVVVHLAQIAGVAFTAAIAQAMVWMAAGRARDRTLGADADAESSA